MRGPRCEKHLERHYMKNDCDKCKEERIATLTARLREAEELLRKLIRSDDEAHGMDGANSALWPRADDARAYFAKHGKGA